MTPRTLLIAFALALPACSPALRGPLVTAADLADPQKCALASQQRGFLHRIGTAGVEQTPSGIDRAELSDDVQIQSFDGHRICFEVTLRTDADLDRPLASWVFRVGGQPTTVRESGAPTTRSFPMVYDRTIVNARTRRGDFQITQPVEGSYQVVQRHGTVCGSISKRRPATVELLMKIPGAIPYEDWYDRYYWVIE